MLAPLREASERHARQQVAQGARGERQRQIRVERRRQHEREERAPEPDAKKDGDGFVGAEAGGHQLPLQLAHLIGRLRRHAAESLQRVQDDAVVSRIVGRQPDARAGHLAEAALDRRAAAG